MSTGKQAHCAVQQSASQACQPLALSQVAKAAAEHDSVSSTCPDGVQHLENEEALHGVVVNPREQVAGVQPHILRMACSKIDATNLMV